MTGTNKDGLAKPAKKPSTLDLKFLSHGTLESRNLDFTRSFYEEFMGFEVIRPQRLRCGFDWAETIYMPWCR